MKITRLLLYTCLLFLTTTCLGQAGALTFQDAAKAGVPFQHLDSLYKSAVHTDTAKAVFKTAAEQRKLSAAYTSMIVNLSSYLSGNGFKWNTATRCFNRVYFRPDGGIDYFLYNFIPKPGQDIAIDEKKRKEFEKLLNDFIKTYRFPLTAPERFAQCSPVVYADE